MVWGRLKDIGLGGIKWELYGGKTNNDQEGDPQVVKEHDGDKESNSRKVGRVPEGKHKRMMQL